MRVLGEARALGAVQLGPVASPSRGATWTSAAAAELPEWTGARQKSVTWMFAITADRGARAF